MSGHTVDPNYVPKDTGWSVTTGKFPAMGRPQPVGEHSNPGLTPTPEEKQNQGGEPPKPSDKS